MWQHAARSHLLDPQPRRLRTFWDTLFLMLSLCRQLPTTLVVWTSALRHWAHCKHWLSVILCTLSHAVHSTLAPRTVDSAVACPASIAIRRHRLAWLIRWTHRRCNVGARLSPDCFAGLLFNASGRWTMQEEEPVRSRYVQGGGGGGDGAADDMGVLSVCTMPGRAPGLWL